jgi:predicted nucleotidyltransferase
MNAVIESKLHELRELCLRHHVRRLDLFGSATSDRFDPTRSDIDFVVDFAEVPTNEYADNWFGLLEGLHELFQRPIDLITYRYIRNPYFLESVDKTRVNVYAA